jgi:hypothetical protein
MTLAARVILLLIILPLAPIGCAEPGRGPAPRNIGLDDWRHGVERYIAVEGNGDPNVLRDTTLPSSQKGFALIGQPSVERSADAIGLLLGHRVVADRPWFIYLVSLTKSGSIQEMRLVAFTFEQGRCRWRIGSSEFESLDQYRANHVLESADQPATPFPAPQDKFELTVSDATAQATLAGSTAAWSVDLSSPDDDDGNWEQF